MEKITLISPFILMMAADFLGLMLVAAIDAIVIVKFCISRKFSRPVLAAAVIFHFVLAAILVTGLSRISQKIPQAINSSIPNGATLNNYPEGVDITFDAPIDFDKLKANANPDTPATWKFHRYLPFLPFGNRVSFLPRRSYQPDERIMLYLSNLNVPFSQKFGGEYLFEFKAPALPRISGSDPADGASDVPLDIPVSFLLDAADSPQAEWSLEINPFVSYQIKRGHDRKISINFPAPLSYNTLYHIRLFRTPVVFDVSSGDVIRTGRELLVKELSFTTAKPPLVQKFSPFGNQVAPDAKIEITFDQPVVRNSLDFRITPETSGSASWNAAATVWSFQPEILTRNSKYSVTLGKGLKNSGGTVLAADLQFDFATAGLLEITHSTPHKTQPNVPVDTSINITFNQEVDHAVAETKFSLTPPVTGTFSWNGNTMIYQPAPALNYDTKYVYAIAPGVIPLHGVLSDKTYTGEFTTAPREVNLPVPFLKQEELFTCNIAAARMLLAYRGINLTEAELKAKIGSAGTRGNGNPNLGYVSDYGTHWDPVYQAVSMYRPSRLYQNWSLAEILAEVVKGNPVMIWGQNGWSDPHEISWTNPDGTKIYAINGMHSSVVTGFRGTADQPTEILLNDAWRGQTALSPAEFARRLNFFKVALVVD